MTLEEAIELIQPVPLNNTGPQTWADLGCGSGLFSRALATLLPDKSLINCCDQSRQMEMKSVVSGVELQFVSLDFENNVLNVPALDGILMANSLHYVKDKKSMLLKWKKLLNPEGLFIVIEYDINVSNPWVPFPIPFLELQDLFIDLGFNCVSKTGQRKSVYDDRNMYACVAGT